MMLSRFADNAFWLGRYIERTESIVRMISVTEGFALDGAETDAWTPVLKVYSDEKAFAATEKAPEARAVASFYLTDRSNPNSAISCVTVARENARTLRHLISTESWRQISILYDHLTALAKRRVAVSKLSQICEDVRLSCCALRGAKDTTWYRDEVWLFNRLGTTLERADQMTRFMDMKYFQVTGGEDSPDDAPQPMPDVAWWNTLLRAASGYHAFQRLFSFNPQPEDAAAFLLQDLSFPRSVRGAAEAAFETLDRLDKDFSAKPGQDVKGAAKAFADRLEAPPARLTGRSLHRYLDDIQKDIMSLANALNERYFSPT